MFMCGVLRTHFSRAQRFSRARALEHVLWAAVYGVLQTNAQKSQARTWSAVKKSGTLRRTNSLKDSPFSTTILGGSGRTLSGGGKLAVLRAAAPSSIWNTGAMISRRPCTTSAR